MKNTITIRNEALRQRVIEHITALNIETPWVVSIERETKKRTLNQNALYHGWIDEIAGYTGHSHDEIHEWCKAEFLSPRMVEVNGKQVAYRTTTGLSTSEMAAYMEHLYAWVTSDLGIFLTVPEMTDASGAGITRLGGG